jgi:hypothetical protein
MPERPNEGRLFTYLLGFQYELDDLPTDAARDARFLARMEGMGLPRILGQSFLVRCSRVVLRGRNEPPGPLPFMESQVFNGTLSGIRHNLCPEVGFSGISVHFIRPHFFDTDRQPVDDGFSRLAAGVSLNETEMLIHLSIPVSLAEAGGQQDLIRMPLHCRGARPCSDIGGFALG